MPGVATIGVYGFSAGQFLAELREEGVELLIDVRQRRGVRGAEYAWANSARLQDALSEAGIEYLHRKDLAPTTAMRERQYEEDARQGVGQRSRVELSQAFRDAYVKRILEQTDLPGLRAELSATGTTALLCVEREPAACHRSILAERLGREAGVDVRHLRPPGAEPGDQPSRR
jgi:uncharacterized protein (DUF488 family)